jgi:hypothetical protein
MNHQIRGMAAKKLWLIAALECMLNNICPTQPSSLYFIHWCLHFKKLCDCMVANPFVSSVEIAEAVLLLWFHPIGHYCALKKIFQNLDSGGSCILYNLSVI